MTEGWVTARAPGRVNLIGEHTDYHEGYVLPTVLPQQTTASVRPRSDRVVCTRSEGVDDSGAQYILGEERRSGTWVDYVQGVTAVLAERGLRTSGFDLHVRSDVPLGAGVSSSAALEVSLMRALRDAFGFGFDDLELARMAQRVETDFVGAPVGIMDQMACSLGRSGDALFIDTRSLAFERLPLPPMDLVVIASGVIHRHAGGDYVTRRRESLEAARYLGVESLRDVNASALPQLDALPPILARRARHVITENQRVLDAVAVIRAGDAPRLGAVFNASHVSMRDDYEVSTPEVDTLVRVAQKHPRIFGARLTGGGFGGAVVMLAEPSRGREAAVAIRQEYQRLTGREGTVLVPET
jgi:galactokinase